VRCRVGDVGSAAEDRDCETAFERAAVNAGVDTEGESAHHDQAGGGQLPPQRPCHLTAVGAGAAGTDHRHGARGLQPLEGRGTAPPHQGPGGVGGVTQPDREPRVVAAAGPALRSDQIGSQAPLRDGGHLPQDLLRHVRGRSRREALVRKAQQFRRAHPGGAGGDPLDVGSKASQQPRSAQALGTGAHLAAH
jgi:hypothetical protein